MPVLYLALRLLLAAGSLAALDGGGVAWEAARQPVAIAAPAFAALRFVPPDARDGRDARHPAVCMRTPGEVWLRSGPLTARTAGRVGVPSLQLPCWRQTGRRVACSLAAVGGEEGGGREEKSLANGGEELPSPNEGRSNELLAGSDCTSRLGSLGAQSEAAWPLMRDMGKIRDECKALLSESRELVLHDFELAKQKWETALDTVESTGEHARVVTMYNLVLNLCALAAARGRTDALETALDVMSRMVERGANPTLVSFNTLMNVCAKSAACGLGEQAVTNAHNILHMMEDAHTKPDAITFTSMLDACARAAAVRGGRGGWTRGWQNGLRVLELMKEKGVGRTAMTYNVLISICVTGASTRREGVWVQEAVNRGVSVLNTMREDGVRPDSDTYNHLLTVCAKAASAGYKDAAVVAHEVFADLSQEGRASEMGVETWNALVNTYAKCANFTLAEQLVSVEMPAAGVTPDRITWNTVMHAVANEAMRGRLSGMQYGLQVLEAMKASGVEPDVRTYNSLLRACTVTAWGRGSDSVRPRGAWVIDRMRANGIEPDLITFTTLLDACVRAATQDEDGGRGEAMQVLQEMEKAGLSPNVVTCNCLLSACAKAASTHGLIMVDNGLELLQMMKGMGVAPDIISFNTLISACSFAASNPQRGYKAGDALARGLLVVREMQAHGLQPNVISFTSLLSAGARAIKNEGDVTVLSQARALVALMRDSGVRADVVTYTAILDINAKAAAQGQVGEWVALSLQVLQDMREASVAPTGITCAVFVETCVNSVNMLKGDSKGRSAQKRIRRIFDRLDRDGDGRISSSELLEASSLLQSGRSSPRLGSAPLPFENVTVADVSRFMRMADEDGDGSITYPEFENMIVDSAKPRSLGVLPKMGTERCVSEGRGLITVAWKVMCDMQGMGISVNVLTCNALLDAVVVVAGLGPLGRGVETYDLCFEDASKIFWMMDKYGIVSWPCIAVCTLG
jgi:pentatricopeptide repeat protein